MTALGFGPGPFDLSQCPRLVLRETCAMNRPDEPAPGKKAPEHQPARSEEARRIIEEYLNDLRAIIEKLLRRRLN
jgi:hypothetical protein